MAEIPSLVLLQMLRAAVGRSPTLQSHENKWSAQRFESN